MNARRYDNAALREGYARWWLLPVIVIVTLTVLAVAAVLALPVNELPLPDPERPLAVRVMLAVLYLIIATVVLNLVRHYVFTLNRLFGASGIPTSTWTRPTGPT